MRVLAACSLGGSGHLQPLLPMLDAAKAAGHETLIVAPPAMSNMVAATGFPFSPGGEPPESIVAPIREQLPIASAQEAAVLANRDLFGAVATDAMLSSMVATVSSWQPDLILRDPCEFASAIVAHDTSIVVAQIAIGLAEVEWNSIKIAAPALEERRRGLVTALLESNYCTRFPGSLDASLFAKTRRYAEPPSVARSPLPDWWNGSRLPLVYMTFGTVLGHMTIADEVYGAALEAAGDLEARVLLTVGRRFDRASLGVAPPNVHVEAWVDQDTVFDQADVVVCHGGSGTTFGALRAGVPVVVVPLFADQDFNGVKVAESRSGIVVDVPRYEARSSPFARDDASRVAEATRTVLSEPKYREQARAIGQEMALAPAPADLLRTLLNSTP